MDMCVSIDNITFFVFNTHTHIQSHVEVEDENDVMEYNFVPFEWFYDCKEIKGSYTHLCITTVWYIIL